MIPYLKRKDLTEEEKAAISHYKDINNPQYKWELKVKRQKDVGIDCQIVNGVLRDDHHYSELSSGDKKRFTRIKNLINSAVKKSKTREDLRLFKGVKPFDKLVCYSIGAKVPQPAFSSFTTNAKLAKRYAGKKKGEYIFFYLKLNKGSHALYVDSDEDEWILATDCVLQVTDIKHTSLLGVRAIVYYLKLTT